MKIIQLPEGVNIPNEILSHINIKAMKAPKELRMEYTQLLISNWIKINYEDEFIKNISMPRNVSFDLKQYLEE